MNSSKSWHNNAKKVLVIGSGGREHALIKAFSQSASITKIFSCPGNAGISRLATIVPIDPKDFSAITKFCQVEGIDFVFIGPEDPLVNGITDELRKNKINVIGPSKKAAQLEGSKIFAKNFMLQSKVPTAEAITVKSVKETLAAAESHSAPYILKADGLAAGKGVFICKNKQELEQNAKEIFEMKTLGPAGEIALLEKNLPGYELSFLVLTNGESFQALPLAQDHKRLKNNNLGPNTGGMGTLAPLKIPTELNKKIINKIVTPSIQQIKTENQKDPEFSFYGVLFIGIMVVDNEPYVLEYNVRFGDPETQVILPLVENDLGEVFHNLSKGKLDTLNISESLSAFCIVNAAAGYPEHPEKNIPIQLPIEQEQTYILHAGTKLNEKNELVSNGGRVLNVVSVAADLKKAKKNAYELNQKIQFPGRQFRTDIGD